MNRQWWKTRRIPVLIAALALALTVPFGVGYAHESQPTSEPEAAPAAAGELSVCGTKLCDESGQPVQLRGMSTHGLQWYSQCVNDASLDALANDWGADVIRASMYIQDGGYEDDPEGFTALMNTIIAEATERGMYVIIDWHMLEPGDPNANLDLAKEFFATMSARHADATNVIYEIANEPSGVEWPQIKSYHEQVIPVIRENDPNGVILLGTPDWSSLGLSGDSDETEVINDQVDADNIMYTFHFYAASHREEYLSALDRASDQIPMFVSEFGTQEYTGDGPNDFDMSGRFLDLMDDKQISWVNWNFSDDQRSGAVFNEGTCPSGPFDNSNLKPAGEWIFEQMKAGR